MNKRNKNLFSLILVFMVISTALMGCGSRAARSEASSQESASVVLQEIELENFTDKSSAVESGEEIAEIIETTELTEEGETDTETEETDAGTVIQLDFAGTIVTAVLDNSETTQAFMDRLPLTISMNRYADREYYAAIPELPQNGEEIPDFENGDITYYTSGKSLAIFFGNADSSSQGDLIRMGCITSDLTVFDDMADSLEVTISLAKGEADMEEYDFSEFPNVEITGVDFESLDEEQLAVLYQQVRYLQAMTDADIETLDEIVSDDMVFTHMSGRQQTKEEYFADIEDGSLNYYFVELENPEVVVDGDIASVSSTHVLNANAYGAKGSYPMSGTRWFEKRDGIWYAINAPEE